MADEKRISINMSLSNGNLKGDQNVSNLKLDQTTQRKVDVVQTVGTSSEVLYVGDLAQEAECYLRNLDSTNFVQVGIEVAATFYPVFRLAAGDEMPLAGKIDPTATIYVKADTSACDIVVFIMDA